MTRSFFGGVVGACVFTIAMISVAGAQTVCDQNTRFIRPIPLGISGGNINDHWRSQGQRVCSGGTLGSMVQDSSGNQYILSNNHVLARENQARRHEKIVQPGLQDALCVRTKLNTVANLSNRVKISFKASGVNLVDAAIALVQPDEVTPFIRNIGAISGDIAVPVPGMNVQKMGSRTCLTQAQITAVDVNVRVNYSSTDKPKLANFNNQILIQTTDYTFADHGDSGSLIVTTAACPQAVGLLFAGSPASSDSNNVQSTFANPISDVLSALSVQMVGQCSQPTITATTTAAQDQANAFAAAVHTAAAVRDAHNKTLMGVPGALGTGIGVDDQSGALTIQVYLKQMTVAAQDAAPAELDGTPVELIAIGEVNAL